MHANETPKPMPVDWRQSAACRSMAPAVFYPEKTDAAGRSKALAICARCTVRDACLDEALTQSVHLDQGIRAGLSAIERRRMRAKRRRIAS